MHPNPAFPSLKEARRARRSLAIRTTSAAPKVRACVRSPTTALTVIRLVEPGQCSTELVDPATVTTLVRSQTDFFSRTATADQTNPLATPNGAGPSVDMLVGFFYTETECTIEWSLVNLQGSSWTGPPDRAHIHGPAAEGSNAGVMVTIFNDPTLAIGTSLISGTNIVGSATVAQSICDTMYDGLAYINFVSRLNIRSAMLDSSFLTCLPHFL